VYTIQKGDTLSGIAEKALGAANRWPEIHKINKQIKNPNLIFPGQKIKMPNK